MGPLRRSIHVVLGLILMLGLAACATGLKSAPGTPTAVITIRHAESPGQTVFWVGNTTNLGNIFGRLGRGGAPPSTYGDIHILSVLAEGPTRVAKRRVGR